MTDIILSLLQLTFAHIYIRRAILVSEKLIKAHHYLKNPLTTFLEFNTIILTLYFAVVKAKNKVEMPYACPRQNEHLL